MNKIALEEHFCHPSFPEYSIPGIPAETEGLLADFDSLRIETMDAGGIGKSILSLTAPGVEAASHANTAISDARSINDFLANQIEHHPDRLGGFAALPMQSPDAAADELQRAVLQLGFHGALIKGHTHGHYLDEDRFLPFWERVAELERPVYLHPTNAFQVPQNYQDHPELMGAIWGWTSETATHVLRLIFAGLFDRYPSLQVIIGHGGETLPYLLWRVDSRYEWLGKQPALKKLPFGLRTRQRVDHYFRTLFHARVALCDRATGGRPHSVFS